MKYFRFNCKHAPSHWLVVLAVCVLSLNSCDKLGDLVDKAKELVGDEKQAEAASRGTVEVESVNEKSGKAVIAEESRMVMVEFYSDT